MDEEEERNLINELEALNLRATEIIERLATRDAGKRTGRATRAHDWEVIAKPTTTSSVSELTINGLKKGDRVRIKNKVIKPATWPIERPWIKEEARRATITRVTRDQIHFVTDNGTATWRAPNNLERIE
jgi:hypothetical protein